MVISAMKMETVVSAPCSGEISALADLEAGRGVVAGEVVALITPISGEVTTQIDRANSMFFSKL